MRNKIWKRWLAVAAGAAMTVSMTGSVFASGLQTGMSEANPGVSAPSATEKEADPGVSAPSATEKEADPGATAPSATEDDANPGVATPSSTEENGLRLTLSGSVEGQNVEMVNAAVQNCQLQIAMRPEGEDGAVLNLEASFLGVPLIQLLEEMDSERISFSLPLTDESVYTISWDKLVNLLAGPFSGAAELGQAAPQFDEEHYTEVLTPYLSLFQSYISESTQVREDATVALENLHTSFVGDLYYVEPTEEQTAQLLNDLADTIEDDDNLAQIVSEWAAYVQVLEETLNGTDGSDGETDEQGVAQDEADEQGIAQEMIESYDDLPQALREMSQELPEYGDSGIHFSTAQDQTGTDAFFDFGVGAAGSETLKMGLEAVTDASGETQLAIYFGDASTLLRVIGTFSSEEETTDGQLTLYVNSMELGTLTWNYDGSVQTVLGVPAGKAELSISGGIKAELRAIGDRANSNYILTVNGLQNLDGTAGLSGGTAYQLGTASSDLQSDGDTGETSEESTKRVISSVTFNLNAAGVSAEDLALSVPEGTRVDLSGYTLEQLEDLITQLAENAAAYVERMFSD